ncbi:MAG: winged helix-turn-helix transcriptional regulator [Phycisphaerae bacterium]|nr:winged helix-turn-helix transcriptional regulator [Phycisphaerae bacterium]
MPRGPESATVFHAVAHPSRRRILDLLGDEEIAATVLARRFTRRMSQPAISQHLKVLHGAGLVARRRVGRQRLYRATPGPLREIMDWVSHYEKFWDERLGALRRHLDSREGVNG